MIGAWKKIIAMIISLVMVFGIVGINVYGEPVEEPAVVCPHHIHDDICGYSEGTPCSHVCSVESGCITEEKNCIHIHDASCYSDGILPEEGEEKTADNCSHVCSVESGCITEAKRCIHVHDDECGYSEGTPCTFTAADCEICSAVGGISMEEKDTAGTQRDANGQPTFFSTGAPVVSVKVDDATYDYYVGTEEGEYTDAEAALNAAWTYCQGKTATLTLHQNVGLSDDKTLYISNAKTDLTLEMDSDVTLSKALPRSGGILIRISFGTLNFASGTMKITSSPYAYSGDIGILVNSSTGKLIFSGGELNIDAKTPQSNVIGVKLTSGSFEMNAGSILITHLDSRNGSQMNYTAGVDIQGTATASISGEAEIIVNDSDKDTENGIYGIRMVGQSLTISGNPTISSKLALQDSPADGDNYTAYGIDVQSGNLQVTGTPTVTATNNTQYGSAVGLNIQEGATASVAGGSYTGTMSNGTAYGLQAAGDGLNGQLSGGSFEGNSNSVVSSNAVRNLLASGFAYFNSGSDEEITEINGTSLTATSVEVKTSEAPTPELRDLYRTYTSDTATITGTTLAGVTVYCYQSQDDTAPDTETIKKGKSVTADVDGTFSILINSLQPDTSYIYYLVAENSGKYSAVEKVSFITEPKNSEVNYMDWNGSELVEASCTNYRVVDTNTTIWGAGDDIVHWYLVNENNVNISDRIKVQGDVCLILADGCQLTADDGIELGEGSSLTIYGQEKQTGKLTVNGNNCVLGATLIDSSYGTTIDTENPDFSAWGNLTVNGGEITVTAASDDTTESIGYNYAVNVNTLTINNGSLTAESSTCGASNRNYSHSFGTRVENLVMNGGTLTTTGGTANGGADGNQGYSAGLSVHGNFEMNDGLLTATGGDSANPPSSASAISSSFGIHMASDDDESFAMNGGEVIASGGVARGSYGIYLSGDNTVTFNGGTVKASGGNGTNSSYGIRFNSISDPKVFGGNLLLSYNENATDYADLNFSFLYWYGGNIWHMDGEGSYIYPHKLTDGRYWINYNGKSGTYCYPVIVNLMDVYGANKEVTNAFVTISMAGFDGLTYGLDDVVTNDEGKVCLLLPGTAGGVSVTANFNGANYTGTVYPTNDESYPITNELKRVQELNGSISITGTPKVGETLTVDSRGITSTDPGTLTYTWYRCDENGTNAQQITSAAEASYTMTDADENKYIKVVVTAEKYSGSLEAIINSAVLPVPVHTVLKEDGSKAGTYNALDDAFQAAQNGYTVVLGYSDVLGEKIPENVTLQVPKDITLTVNDLTNLSQGKLEIQSGGKLMLGTTALVGDSSASLNLKTGSVVMDGDTVTLTARSEAEIPAGKTFYLMLGSSPSPALNAVIADEAILTVAEGGTLKAVSGNGTAGSQIKVYGTLDVQGTITVAEKASVQIEGGGYLKLKQLSQNDIVGTGDGTGIKGDIIFCSGAKFNYNNNDVIGTAAEPVTLQSGGTATLNLGGIAAEKPVDLTVNGDVIMSEDVNVYMGVGAFQVPICITLETGKAVIEENAVLNLMDCTAGGSSLNIKEGAELEVSGVMEVHEKAAFSGTANVSGKVYVFDTDSTNPANGATFSLTGSGEIYALKTDIADKGTSVGNAVKETGEYSYAGEKFIYRWSNQQPVSEEYWITFNPNGGSVTPDKMQTVNKKLSSLPVPVKSGYKFDAWYTEESGGTPITVDYEFIQDTTIYAHWTKISNSSGSSGGNDGISTSPVIVEETEHGTVEVSPKNASKGKEVTITVIPEEGYELDTLKVTDKNGNEIDVKEENGEYTFEMPDCRVTITSVFRGITENGSDYVSCLHGKDCPMWAFTDLDVSEWYHDGIHFCLDEGLMAGSGADTFSPGETTSRGMIVAILYRLAGSPAVEGENPFTDVAEGQYYRDAVVWATGKGIVSGFGDGIFAPDAPITREQLAVMLYNYAAVFDYDIEVFSIAAEEYSDYPQTSAYAKTALNWAVDTGIIHGMGDGTLAPQGQATRAEAATMLMNFCENVVK